MKNRPIRQSGSFFVSVKNACKGILYALKTERHMRFHLFAGIVVTGSSIFFEISSLEWLFIIYAIGSVITAELFNTAIERTVDLAKPEYHPIAGMAKDVASGAVLVTSFQAVIIGGIIFWPYIF